MRLPIKPHMREAVPEPRMPVMIMVDASWQDQSGTVQTVRARIENKSTGGARIRLNTKILVGTRLHIEGQWEKFSGEARYCHKDGRDYLVGIQKDKPEWPSPARVVGKVAQHQPQAENSIEASAGVTSMEAVREVIGVLQWTAPIPTKQGNTREANVVDQMTNPQPHGLQHAPMAQEIQQLDGQATGQERKHMKRKWFEMGHKEEDHDGLTTVVNDAEEPANRALAAPVSADPILGDRPEALGGSNQLELLPMEDVYRMAGILNPRKGYSINKITEMLHSEHLRGISKDMKRASVLMALDAAGVTVEEVLQDAKARQDAIDSYEAEQRRQFEAQLARKAEENSQIQAEMERVKARYTERLRRNLDGMAREKATFGNWLTLKQQESQSILEAVDMCLKPSTPEAPSTPLDEVSLAGARVKPV
jgi:hypothetical protein